MQAMFKQQALFQKRQIKQEKEFCPRFPSPISEIFSIRFRRIYLAIWPLFSKISVHCIFIEGICMFTFVGYVVISLSFFPPIGDISVFRLISSQKTGAISLKNGLKIASPILYYKVNLDLLYTFTNLVMGNHRGQ